MKLNVEEWRAFFDEHVKRDNPVVDGYLRYVQSCAESGIPPIFEERHLSLMVGVPYNHLLFYTSASASRYRKFEIPKRSGGRRVISVPAPILLHVQRWILRSILNKLPISDYAHGGVTGRSIVTNAKIHLGASSVLRMDLCRFFDNIPLALGVGIFEAAGYPPRVSRSLALLCFEQGCLPQGGATSSALANLASIKLDARLSALASSYDLKYSRYVDDLTFSGRSIGRGFAVAVGAIIQDCKFEANSEKTQLVRGASPKFVTGLSVGGSKLRVPRSFKRKVKNEAFQIIKRGIHNHIKAVGSSDPLVMERTLGQLAFWLHVEPDAMNARNLFNELQDYRGRVATDIVLPPPRRIAPIVGDVDLREKFLGNRL